MHTIFNECQDLYGQCMRQYIDTVLILLVSLVSLWSCYQTYKEQRQPTFELIPLGINFMVTLLMFCMQLIYEQFYNTHLVFMFIEFFTYYLLTYALVFMYFKADVLPQVVKMRKLNLMFSVGSIVIIVLAVGVTVLSVVDVIQCTGEYWVSTLVQMFVELPIFGLTLVYCSKTKEKIRSLNEEDDNKARPTTLHYFHQQDSYVKLKLLQTNLIQITFTITMLLHLAEIILYGFMEEESICLPNTNKIEVRNVIELSIMMIKNLSELVPHLMILLIFWIIPEKIERKQPSAIYITAKLINQRLSANLQMDNDDDQEIHKKLII